MALSELDEALDPTSSFQGSHPYTEDDLGRTELLPQYRVDLRSPGTEHLDRFIGTNQVRPCILFLGAAEGYEAMQLAAMYPGAEVVPVDYDEFCKTDRFGHFPESYPFLGVNPSTGGPGVWYKDDMYVHYVIDDIRNLPYGKEFDIVLSVGLLEHFPDEYKHEVMEWHRKFLKPNGFDILRHGFIKVHNGIVARPR